MLNNIAIILTAHAENSLIINTLKSIECSRAYAFQFGIVSDLCIVLDNANETTKRIINEFIKINKTNATIIETSFGCPALARNFAIDSMDAKYIAIQDGDDLVSENWFKESYELLEENSNEILIVHPEWNLTFDNENVIMRHPCMREDNDIFLGNLIFENYWTALCICKKTVFKNLEYRSNKLDKSYGYEDWDWNLRSLEKGYIHTISANTFHFIRRKLVGVSFIERGKSSIVRPSRIFIDKRFTEPKEKRLTFPNRNNILNEIDEIAYLRCHPDIKDGVERGYFSSGDEHFKNYGFIEGRLAFPKGTVDCLLKQSEFEYLLYPDSDFLSKYTYYKPIKINEGTLSAQRVLNEVRRILITKTLLFKFDTVVTAPWVLRGGADMALLFHLEYLASTNKTVLLILTEKKESTWLDKVPKKISVLDLGNLGNGLTRVEKKSLLFHILMLLNIKNFHNINSEAAWDVLRDYGDVIHNNMRVIVSLYCYDYTPLGKPVGYPFYLKSTANHLDLIYSDNPNFVKHMNEYYGVDYSNMVSLYHPISNYQILKNKDMYDSKSKNVLWASRLDRQKRPDVLYEIAKISQDLTFYVFGTHILDNSDILEALQKLNNVKLMGPFDGFHSLDKEKYFTFLYTSQWDGLPNILLEAAASGLPIIAPSIGGISDFLSNNRGLLCNSTESVDQYVEHLLNLKNDFSLSMRIINNMRAYIEEKHNYEYFNNQLVNSGY